MASLDFEENKNQSQLGKLGTGDKNTTRIRCERCNSLIISPGNATYATKEARSTVLSCNLNYKCQ